MQEPPHQQISILLECLKRFDAPAHFSLICQFLSEKFIEDFVKNVFFDQIKRDSALAPISSKIDRYGYIIIIIIFTYIIF